MNGNDFLSGAISGLGFGYVAHSWSVIPGWMMVVLLAGLCILTLLTGG